MRKSYLDINAVKLGAYPIIEYEDYHATVFSSGSEVEIAVNAAKQLVNYNINLRVISF